jgi:hypothetical protein
MLPKPPASTASPPPYFAFYALFAFFFRPVSPHGARTPVLPQAGSPGRT